MSERLDELISRIKEDVTDKEIEWMLRYNVARALIAGEDLGHIVKQLTRFYKVAVFAGKTSENQVIGIMDQEVQVIEDANEKILSQAQTSRRVRYWQEKGLSVGFIHGAFRIYDLNHMAICMWAATKCDRLVIGMESNYRISNVFTRNVLLSDLERMQMAAWDENNSAVFLVDGDNGGDDYYRELVKNVRPNVYFCSAEYSQSIIAERIRRAMMVGAKLQLTPTFDMELYTHLSQHEYLYDGSMKQKVENLRLF